ncbi:hypothetical protein T492DRAFT_851389, partial [Pavlovales sp. CCMP2436]
RGPVKSTWSLRIGRACIGFKYEQPGSSQWFIAPGHSSTIHRTQHGFAASDRCSVRKTLVLNLASEQNGWETPPRDKEWRRWLGEPGAVHSAIAQLRAALRTTVDGIWYTFERGSGKIIRQGGSHTSLNQDVVLSFVPNVLTRSLWGRNVRQVGKVQVIGRGGGATVAGLDVTLRLRDARSPEPL